MPLERIFFWRGHTAQSGQPSQGITPEAENGRERERVRLGEARLPRLPPDKAQPLCANGEKHPVRRVGDAEAFGASCGSVSRRQNCRALRAVWSIVTCLKAPSRFECNPGAAWRDCRHATRWLIPGGGAGREREKDGAFVGKSRYLLGHQRHSETVHDELDSGHLRVGFLQDFSPRIRRSGRSQEAIEALPGWVWADISMKN